jgi:Sulfotransferase family
MHSAPTGQPLDFIVFGVPRSGTKALVRALNLHPHIYCAMERFHFRTDHSTIAFPASFLDESGIIDQHDLGKVRRVREEIAGKTEIRYVGNKLPRYYFALDRINHELPALKNVWIYRSPYGFMQSWNRRERECHRGRWRPGQIGLFGLLELLCCIDNCLRLNKDIFLFPYDAGLNRSTLPITDTLDFLGATPGLYDLAKFETQYLRRRREASHRLALQDYEEEILDVLAMKRLDAIMEEGGGRMLSAVAGSLKEYLGWIAARLPVAIDRAFATCDNKAATAFGLQHFRRNRAELQGVSKMAQGSEALNAFQTFGFYQRLSTLYLQRWALKRRLFSLRMPALLRSVRGNS